MKRILIFGNSGSGKTHLAQALGGIHNHPVISLDDIFWEPGGFNVKRTEEQVEKDICQLKQTPQWIIEGVFGKHIEKVISRATLLLYLDMPWVICHKSLMHRGSESSKQLNAKQAESNFNELVSWAELYYQRDNENSRNYHLNLFNAAVCEKVIFNHRDHVDSYIEI